MPSWTADDLLARVKRKALVPSVNPKLTDAQLLEVIDEAIQARVYPVALMPRDDAMTDRAILEIAADPTGERNFALLPDYISSSTIVAVLASIAQPGGSPAFVQVPMARISPLVSQTPTLGGDSPVAYSIVGQRIHVYPLPSDGARIVVLFERRPGRLTLTTGGKAVALEAWDNGTSTATLDLGVFTPGVGDLVDVISASPGFFSYGYALPIASITGSDYVLTVDAPTSASDMASAAPPAWVVEHGYSCVFQLPDVFYQSAIYAGAAGYCAEVGDLTQAQANTAELEKLLMVAVKMTSNRVRKQAPVAANYGSPLRAGASRGRWRGWA